MDSKNKLLNNIFAIAAYPVYWLSHILIYLNLFGLKSDYKKILDFRNENEQLPDILLNALVAGEDHRFYLHFGFDPISIFRAIWNVCIKQKRQGGSTIEQQFVRVITNRYEVTISRKLREILLATIIGDSFTKKEILNSYLSIAYFGQNMNGAIQAVARLKIAVGAMSTYQAYSIIARLKYPEPINPSIELRQKINVRASHILNKSYKMGYQEINVSSKE